MRYYETRSAQATTFTINQASGGASTFTYNTASGYGGAISFTVINALSV
jgi:predicted outer membrane repeat protein